MYVLNGPVARICRFHRHGRGSIPRWGIFVSSNHYIVTERSIVLQLFVKENQIDITEQSGSKVICSEHQVSSRPTKDIEKIK